MAMTRARIRAVAFPGVRRDAATVLGVMLLHDRAEWFSPELAELAGLRWGSVYAPLALLEHRGFVAARWSDGPAPRRVVYRLADGIGCGR